MTKNPPGAPNGLPPVVKSRICVASLRCSSVKYVEYSPSSRLGPLATAQFHSVRQTVRCSTRYGLVAAALILTAASPLAAQPAAEPGESDELPRIVISDPNRDLFRLALPDASGERNLSRSATEIE